MRSDAFFFNHSWPVDSIETPAEMKDKTARVIDYRSGVAAARGSCGAYWSVDGGGARWGVVGVAGGWEIREGSAVKKKVQITDTFLTSYITLINTYFLFGCSFKPLAP